MRLSAIEPTPDAFAAVMATGILSIAARNHQYARISETLDVLAVFAFRFCLPQWPLPPSDAGSPLGI